MNQPPDRLQPRTALAQALYALIEVAYQREAVPRSARDLVDEVRSVIEGNPHGASLRHVLSADLDDLETFAGLKESVLRLRRVLPGSSALRRPGEDRPLAHLIPSEATTPEGYFGFRCGCGSEDFCFDDPSHGEIGERFRLRRRTGPTETMWRLSGGFLVGGLQDTLVRCVNCGRVFNAESTEAPDSDR